jgi:hypothetical protein
MQTISVSISDVDESEGTVTPPQPQPTVTWPQETIDRPDYGYSDGLVTGDYYANPDQNLSPFDNDSFMLGDSVTNGNLEFSAISGGSALNPLSELDQRGLELDPIGLGRSGFDIEELYTKPGDQAFRILVTEAEQPALFVFHGMRDFVIAADARSFRVDVPADAFTHTDRNASVFLHAQLSNGRPLPDWIRFDAVQGVFTGTTPNGEEVNIEITVTAMDGNGRIASFTFSIQSADLQHKAGFSQQLRMHSTVVNRG